METKQLKNTEKNKESLLVNKIKWNRKYEPFIIALTSIILSCIFISLPGLNESSAYTEYIAPILLNGKSMNGLYVPEYIGIPLLNKVYHGITSALVGMPFYAIFGTSIVVMRIINALWLAGICLLVYFILKNVTKNRWIPFVVTLVLACHPMMSTSTRTQVYAMMPGVCMVLGAFLMLVSKKRNLSNCALIWSGILCGLAFYTYFSFALYAPGLIAVICLHPEASGKRFKKVLIWIAAFCLGALPMAAGYFNLLLCRMGYASDSSRAIMGALLFAVMYCIIFVIPLVYAGLRKRPGKKVIAVYGGLSLLFLLFLIVLIIHWLRNNMMLNAMNSIFSDLYNEYHVEISNSATFQDKFDTILDFISLYFNNIWNEVVIFDNVKSSVWTQLFKFIFIGIQAYMLLIFALAKKKSIKTILPYVYTILPVIFYVILTIYPAYSYSYKHFFLTAIMLFIACAVALDTALNITADGKKKSVVENTSRTLAAALIILCIFNQFSFFKTLSATGGRGRSDENINIISNKALDDLNEGITALYIFPEWGIYYGFVFLTGDQVQSTVSIDVMDDRESLISWYDKIVICFWDEENSETYLDSFGSYSDDVSEHIYYDRTDERSWTSYEYVADRLLNQ